MVSLPPAQMLMNRCLKSHLLVSNVLLKFQIQDQKQLHDQLKAHQVQQNTTTEVVELPPLTPGQ